MTNMDEEKIEEVVAPAEAPIEAPAEGENTQSGEVVVS